MTVWSRLPWPVSAAAATTRGSSRRSRPRRIWSWTTCWPSCRPRATRRRGIAAAGTTRKLGLTEADFSQVDPQETAQKVCVAYLTQGGKVLATAPDGYEQDPGFAVFIKANEDGGTYLCNATSDAKIWAFEAIGAEGIARVDVFVTPEHEVVLNESLNVVLTRGVEVSGEVARGRAHALEARAAVTSRNDTTAMCAFASPAASPRIRKNERRAARRACR